MLRTAAYLNFYQPPTDLKRSLKYSSWCLQFGFRNHCFPWLPWPLMTFFFLFFRELSGLSFVVKSWICQLNMIYCEPDLQMLLLVIDCFAYFMLQCFVFMFGTLQIISLTAVQRLEQDWTKDFLNCNITVVCADRKRGWYLCIIK